MRKKAKKIEEPDREPIKQDCYLCGGVIYKPEVSTYYLRNIFDDVRLIVGLCLDCKNVEDDKQRANRDARYIKPDGYRPPIDYLMNYTTNTKNQIAVNNPLEAQKAASQEKAAYKLSERLGCTFVQAMQAFNFVMRNPNVHTGNTWSEKAECELRRRKLVGQ